MSHFLLILKADEGLTSSAATQIPQRVFRDRDEQSLSPSELEAHGYSGSGGTCDVLRKSEFASARKGYSLCADDFVLYKFA